MDFGRTLHRGWHAAGSVGSLKSFQRKDKKDGSPPEDPGNPSVDFHGEKRCNQTHESKSDPEAQLARKGAGKEAKLSYSGNRSEEHTSELQVTDQSRMPSSA